MRIPTAGIVFGLSVLALDARVLPQQGSPPADAACSVAAVQAKAPGDTTITAAAWVDATAGRAAALPGGRPRAGARQHGALPRRPAGVVERQVLLPGGGRARRHHRQPDHGPGPRLRLGLDRHRPRRRRSHLGQQPRQGDRLRPSRHARHRGGGQGAHRRLLRPAGGPRLLQRLLERRPAGDDGSAALSRRLRRRDRRRSRHRHADAGRPRRAVPAACWRRRRTTCPRPRSSCCRAARWRPAMPRTGSPTGSSPIRAPATSIRRRCSAPGPTGRAASPPAQVATVRAIYTGLKDPGRQGVRAAVPQGPRGRVQRLARLDHRQRAAGCRRPTARWPSAPRRRRATR